MLTLEKIKDQSLSAINENLMLRNVITDKIYQFPKGLMNYVRRFPMKFNAAYGYLCFVDENSKEYIIKLPKSSEKIREVINILELSGYEREPALIVPFSEKTEKPYPGTYTAMVWRKAKIDYIKED